MNIINCEVCGCNSTAVFKHSRQKLKTLIGSTVEWTEQGHFECPCCGLESVDCYYLESNEAVQRVAMAAQAVKDVKILLDNLNAKGISDASIWRVLRLGAHKVATWRGGGECTPEAVALLASIWLRPELIEQMDWVDKENNS